MRVGIEDLIRITGLTEYAIRRGIREKRIPYYQVSKNGKYIFDTDLVDEAIRNEMKKNTEVR
ncbi:MAG: hypothetical protein PHE79_03315 [Eubacteriales bacterium]|nr:hypothetical protein [Eubacteriales bacterium]